MFEKDTKTSFVNCNQINRRCFFIMARILNKNKNELLDVLDIFMTEDIYLGNIKMFFTWCKDNK